MNLPCWKKYLSRRELIEISLQCRLYTELANRKCNLQLWHLLGAQSTPEFSSCLCKEWGEHSEVIFGQWHQDPVGFPLSQRPSVISTSQFPQVFSVHFPLRRSFVSQAQWIYRISNCFSVRFVAGISVQGFHEQNVTLIHWIYCNGKPIPLRALVWFYISNLF